MSGEVVGLPLTVALAVWVGIVTYRLTRWGARRAGRDVARDRLALAQRWPATLAAVTTVLWAATRVFTFSGPIDAVLSPLVVLGYALAVVVFAMQALDAALERLVTFEPAELSEPGEAERRSWATSLSAIRRVADADLRAGGARARALLGPGSSAPSASRCSPRPAR